jgi:natural product precursor
MKKKSLKKLTLSRESLRRLDQLQLRDAVGGTNTNTCISLCGDISLCMLPTKCTAFEEE